MLVYKRHHTPGCRSYNRRYFVEGRGALYCICPGPFLEEPGTMRLVQTETRPRGWFDLVRDLCLVALLVGLLVWGVTQLF